MCTVFDCNLPQSPVICVQFLHLVDQSARFIKNACVGSRSFRKLQCVSPQCVLCLFHRVCDIVGDVLFSTKASSPYDMALLQLRDSATEAVVPRIAQRFSPGLISGVLAETVKMFLEHHVAAYLMSEESLVLMKRL